MNHAECNECGEKHFKWWTVSKGDHWVKCECGSPDEWQFAIIKPNNPKGLQSIDCCPFCGFDSLLFFIPAYDEKSCAECARTEIERALSVEGVSA